MRYLVGFVCVVAMVALPLSAGAQNGAQGSSGVEQSHSEAPVVPHTKRQVGSFKERAIQERSAQRRSALQVHLDSDDLKVTPTAPEQTQKKERSPGAKAGIAVGVILGVGLVGFGIGAAVAVSNMDIEF